LNYNEVDPPILLILFAQWASSRTCGSMGLIEGCRGGILQMAGGNLN
jgi:hypothetical protein